MTQKSETRAVEARAPQNSCGGWFRDSHNSPASPSQAIPDLIALHLGERFLARLASGGEHG
jgi:hypothetical protein